jgi:hypothetical protein
VISRWNHEQLENSPPTLDRMRGVESRKCDQ